MGGFGSRGSGGSGFGWTGSVGATREPRWRAPRVGAKSACLNTAEAAGRVSPADKARVFAIARGECVEAAAAVEIAALADDTTADAAETVIFAANRLYAMLTGLAR